MARGKSKLSPSPAAMIATCGCEPWARNRSAPEGEVRIAASTTSPSKTLCRERSRSIARVTKILRSRPLPRRSLHVQLFAQLADGSRQVKAFAFAGGDDRDMRMRALGAQSFGAGGRSKNRGIHHVAIEDFVPREIEVHRARHEDIAFAALTQAITSRPTLCAACRWLAASQSFRLRRRR